MGQQTSGPKITAQDKAIFQLKQQRDKLQQYQKRLMIVSEKQHLLAKQAIKDNKMDKAKFYLKLKKQQQSTISNTYAQLDNLEGLIGTIEFKLIEKDVIYGLQQGNQVLAKLNSEISIDKVDKLLDDIQDETIKYNEISDILGELNNLQESEVDEEFNRLNEEINGAKNNVKDNQIKDDLTKLPETPHNAPLPNAPNNNIEVPNEHENLEKQPIAN